jgi:hypothetical protein
MAIDSLRTTALKVERAVAALPQTSVIRDADGQPLIAITNIKATEYVDGVITASDLYELATAVLYLKLERKGKEGEI